MFLRLFSRKHSPKRKGITLIELTLTTAIIVILAGIIFLALDPVVRLQEARYSTALQDAGEITKAIHLFANDLQKEPGNTDEDDKLTIPAEGRMSRMNICMPGVKGNIVPDYCVNLDELVEEGFLPKLAIYDEPDGRMDNVTGFSVYAHGGFWEVLPGQVFVPRSIKFDGIDDYVFTDIPSDYKGLDLNGPGALSMWVKPMAPPPNYQTDFTGLIMKSKAGDPAGVMNYHIHSNYFDTGWPSSSCTTTCTNCAEECVVPRCCVTTGQPICGSVNAGLYPLACPGTQGNCMQVTDPTNGDACISNDPFRGGFCDGATNGTCIAADNMSTRFGLVPDKWQLVVFTWNKEKMVMHQQVIGGGTPTPNRFRESPHSPNVNGTDLPKPLPGQDFFIGARIPNNGHFRGIIDDVRIYDRFLTTEDVNKMTNDTLEDDPISSLKQQYMFNDNPLQTIVRSDYDRQKANAVRTYKTGGSGRPCPDNEVSPPWVHILRGLDQGDPGCS